MLYDTSASAYGGREPWQEAAWTEHGGVTLCAPGGAAEAAVLAREWAWEAAAGPGQEDPFHEDWAAAQARL